MSQTTLPSLLVAAIAGTAAAQTFTIIPPLSPGSDSNPEGISSTGTAVVGIGSLNSQSRAFLYMSGATNPLPDSITSPGFMPTIAHGVSADGLVVSGWGSFNAQSRQAFVWTLGVGTRVIPQTEDTLNDYKISASGTVVVGYFQSPPGTWIPARYDVPSQTVIPLSQMIGREGLTTGVSDDGSTICGWVRISNGHEQAFIWDSAAGPTYLPFLSNDLNRFSWAAAVSADGRFVVGHATTPAASDGQPFRWSAATGMEALPMLPGASTGFATAISADARIVVGGCRVSGEEVGFIWDPVHGTRSLLDLSLGLGLPVSGWQFQRATGLSADGTRIITLGIDPSGVPHGVILRTTPCYANCDGSTTPPLLNVNDFICFQSRFASGDSSANCDGSTTVPILNVNDFVCFQASYVAGCL